LINNGNLPLKIKIFMWYLLKEVYLINATTEKFSNMIELLTPEKRMEQYENITMNVCVFLHKPEKLQNYQKVHINLNQKCITPHGTEASEKAPFGNKFNNNKQSLASDMHAVRLAINNHGTQSVNLCSSHIVPVISSNWYNVFLKTLSVISFCA
ncbi:hypothetical protein ACJX0J_030038, partial [Zea mays]